jgi:hypothetical protein
MVTDTTWSTPIASLPPSAMRRLQLNKRLGERPCLRATNDTDMPCLQRLLDQPDLSATDHTGGAAPR